MNSIHGVVQPWTGKQKTTIPELLMNRQLRGGTPRRRFGGNGSDNVLAARVAWNRKRMQNMILAVGTGTPAAALVSPQARHGSSESSNEASEESNDDVGGPRGRLHRRHRNARGIGDEDDDQGDEDGEEESDEDEDENDDDDMEEDDEDDEADQNPRQSIRIGNARRGNLQWEQFNEDLQAELDPPTYRGAGDDSIASEESGGMDPIRSPSVLSGPVPAMRHEGCVNTAAWLDCGWRLSITNPQSHQTAPLLTEECPTQVITSGDDCVVKFWDVRNGMGMTSPLPGGTATICPFSAPHTEPDLGILHDQWKSYYARTKSTYQAGCVVPLASLTTGHTGNIFHVTPIAGRPGKVVTCGADGFVRMTDLESRATTILINPEYDGLVNELRLPGFRAIRRSMCFSHLFLNQNSGLVCGERGLRLFDIRLSAREQSNRSLVPGACKACVTWPPSKKDLQESDSFYFIVGGSSAEVVLCDVRMADLSSRQIVQRYVPKQLVDSVNVSVSGLDLSRDGQELLVSYENDQIYTFPMFPRAKNPLCPMPDGFGSSSGITDEEGLPVLNELACYGGHFNRFTFLKNAKYAGPNDEYICTGSDSGHAWIYEKSTGSVVSYLRADRMTCNGVIPHPSLPVFVTYGIDTTAKLWRATTPVDSNVDDSAEGRRKAYHAKDYKSSPIVREWDEVQEVLQLLERNVFSDVLPDFIPSRKNVAFRGHLGRVFPPTLGNDLHNLPEGLHKTLYVALQCTADEDENPVQSSFDDLKRRISLMKLQHQADALGLPCDLSQPWKLGEVRGDDVTTLHPADLIPDCPSDWIPYDPLLFPQAWDFRKYFNVADYEDFYQSRYPHPEDGAIDCDIEETVEATTSATETIHNESQSDVKSEPSESSQSSEDDSAQTVRTSLLHTIQLLKDAGNSALESGNLDLAAYRYDKALHYSAFALMSFPVLKLNFAKWRFAWLREAGGYYVEWDPLLHVTVVVRLNLALLFLKEHFAKPLLAAKQAKLALHALKPFCAVEGKIMKGEDLDIVHREDEPKKTFFEATTLQAKAYFRLGSAMYALGEAQKAYRCFEDSVKCSQRINTKPDKLVLRRLADAKRECKKKRKRQSQRLRRALETSRP